MSEIIDKLFLELSQFTTAKTKRELELEGALKELLDYYGTRFPKSVHKTVKDILARKVSQP